MTDLILPDQTAALLKMEPCAAFHENVCQLDECLCLPKESGRQLALPQLLPLEELLTVECGCDGGIVHGYNSRGVTENRCTDCRGYARIPLPEGDYRIGTVKKLVSRGVASTLYEGVFSPLSSEPVHLRQVAWEKVVRCSLSGCRHVHDWEELVLGCDLYDRLATSVDGDPPAGVLLIGEAKP